MKAFLFLLWPCRSRKSSTPLLACAACIMSRIAITEGRAVWCCG